MSRHCTDRSRPGNAVRTLKKENPARRRGSPTGSPGRPGLGDSEAFQGARSSSSFRSRETDHSSGPDPVAVSLPNHLKGDWRSPDRRLKSRCFTTPCYVASIRMIGPAQGAGSARHQGFSGVPAAPPAGFAPFPIGGTALPLPPWPSPGYRRPTVPWSRVSPLSQRRLTLTPTPARVFRLVGSKWLCLQCPPPRQP